MNDERKALAAKGKLKRLVCHFCQKSGHIKQEYWKLSSTGDKQELQIIPC